MPIPRVSAASAPSSLEEQTLPGVSVEVLEVPSPRCELRLEAKDHHASTLCTARGPKLPATWSGAAVLDVGTIALDSDSCTHDALAERMDLRAGLIEGWKRRNKPTPQP